MYNRILIKLSGQVLSGTKNFGVDIEILNRLSNEIKELVKSNIQIGIVIGGGNLFRGSELVQTGINRITSDYIGMFSTIINALIVKDSLCKIKVKTNIMSSIPSNCLFDEYNSFDAVKALNNYEVVIFSAGIGRPFFTTDSAACLIAAEINADIMLKATRVEGVFSADPIKNPNAKLFRKLNYDDMIDKKLKIIDFTALMLAKDNGIPIHVFNINKPKLLKKVLNKEEEGTLIC